MALTMAQCARRVMAVACSAYKRCGTGPGACLWRSAAPAAAGSCASRAASSRAGWTRADPAALAKTREMLAPVGGGKVRVEKRDGGVAVVTLCNGARANALSGAMMADLASVVEELEAWHDGKAVFVQGRCGGAKLSVEVRRWGCLGARLGAPVAHICAHARQVKPAHSALAPTCRWHEASSRRPRLAHACASLCRCVAARTAPRSVCGPGSHLEYRD